MRESRERAGGGMNVCFWVRGLRLGERERERERETGREREEGVVKKAYRDMQNEKELGERERQSKER